MATAQIEVREITVRSADGLMLHGRWWRRPGPRGMVIVSHGFGEHGGSYARVADVLGSALDLDVLAVDFRGHGSSPGRRGVVRAYDDLTNDLQSAVDWASLQSPRWPPVSARTFQRRAGRPSPRTLQAIRDRWDHRFEPGVTNRIADSADQTANRPVACEIRPLDHVTRESSLRPADPRPGDPARASHRSPTTQSHECPTILRHGRGGRTVDRARGEIRLPTSDAGGRTGPDRQPTAAREFYDRLGSVDKTLLIYPKMLHEPLNELGAEQVLDDVVRWLESHLVAAD